MSVLPYCLLHSKTCLSGKMAGKEDRDEEVICQTYMVKRSQNKKRFTPINYKERWFVLTKNALVYYDTDGEVSFI